MNSSVLIDRDGTFNRKIEEELNLSAGFCSGAVVSIIGGQSTGKSTLLNRLFGTKFQEMNAARGRFQTTKGIWVAKTSSEQGSILIIDTEGSDGKEREGDENFEKQTALFALAVSNIVIVNMMCTDLGRDKGAGWPLLRTAIEVMLRRFNTPHEVTLVFVLRDKTDSPLEALEKQLKGEMHKMLKEVTGPQAQGNAALDHRIRVKVVATSHYLHKKEDFLREVDDLREWIINYTSSSEGVAKRTAGFVQYAENIWDDIKKNKDLNLPSYKIMVAEVRCNLIAKEKLEFFCKNKSWLQIEKAVELGEVVQEFGKEVSSLIDSYLSQYHEEAQYYDETKRTEISTRLTENLLQVVKPTYLSLVKQMRNANLENFQKAAGEELKSKGKLKKTEPCKFIDEFRIQLQEAAVEQAKWNQTTEHELTQLNKEITNFTDLIGGLNKRFQDKKERREFWLKVAELTTRSILTIGVCVAASVSGGGGAAGASILQNFADIAKLVPDLN